jgi:hypothetical protein
MSANGTNTMAISASPTSGRAARGRILGVVGAVAIVALGRKMAYAQDDDDDLTFEQKIIQNIMGGLGANVGAGIDYRERSPLVIPPTQDLPPPEPTAAKPADPNWPVDPEQRRRAKAKNTRPIPEYEQMRALRPSELNVAGRPAQRSAPATPPPGGTHDDLARPLPPSALGYKGGIFGSLLGRNDTEVGTFAGEPPRTNLTEPPPGYQTPAAGQPYGVTPEKNQPAKPASIWDRGTNF